MARHLLQITTATVTSILVVLLASAAPANAEVPEWIKMNTNLWVNGSIDDETYLASIGWLIDNGVIKLEQNNAEISCDEIKDTLFTESFALVGSAYAVITNPTLFIYIDVDPEALFSLDGMPDIPKSCLKDFSDFDALLLVELSEMFGDLTAEMSEMRSTDKQCSLFCDSTGYEPVWAKDIGLNQAKSRCLNIISGDGADKDLYWCAELAGYMLDQ